MYSILIAILIAWVLIDRMRSGQQLSRPVKIPVATMTHRRYLRRIIQR